MTPTRRTDMANTSQQGKRTRRARALGARDLTINAQGYVSRATYEQLAALAAANERTVSAEVRLAVKAHLARHLGGDGNGAGAPAGAHARETNGAVSLAGAPAPTTDADGTRDAVAFP
jgi:hypothetical protein